MSPDNFIIAPMRVNDAYAAYKDLGAPNQLVKAQVAEIKSKSTGAPLETRTVKIGRDGKFTQDFDLRENAAALITLKPQRRRPLRLVFNTAEQPGQRVNWQLFPHFVAGRAARTAATVRMRGDER